MICESTLIFFKDSCSGLSLKVRHVVIKITQGLSHGSQRFNINGLTKHRLLVSVLFEFILFVSLRVFSHIGMERII